jgi:hypothetical protein
MFTKLILIINFSDRKANVGTIECRMCQETYSTAIHCKTIFFLYSLMIFYICRSK